MTKANNHLAAAHNAHHSCLVFQIVFTKQHMGSTYFLPHKQLISARFVSELARTDLVCFQFRERLTCPLFPKRSKFQKGPWLLALGSWGGRAGAKHSLSLVDESRVSLSGGDPSLFGVLHHVAPPETSRQVEVVGIIAREPMPRLAFSSCKLHAPVPPF